MAPNRNGQTTPPLQLQLPPQDHHQHHQDQMDLHDFLQSAAEEVSYEDLPPPFEAYHEQNQPNDLGPPSVTPYPLLPQTPPINFPHDQINSQPQAYPPPVEPVVLFPPPQSQATYQVPVQFPPPQSPATYQEPVVQLPLPPQSQAPRPPTAYMVPTTPNLVVGVPGIVATNMWSSDLFDCFDDLELAILTTFCPCVTFGQIAEIVDSGQTSCGTSGAIYGAILFLIGLPCLISCSYRSKLRSRYNLVESPADDWLIHCFCDCCALCQEYRELQHRGFDPSIGWMANLARDQMLQQQQQPNGMLTPPANQTMMSR